MSAAVKVLPARAKAINAEAVRRGRAVALVIRVLSAVQLVAPQSPWRCSREWTLVRRKPSPERIPEDTPTSRCAG
jgi:hypothetical protein